MYRRRVSAKNSWNRCNVNCMKTKDLLGINAGQIHSTHLTVILYRQLDLIIDTLDYGFR